MIDRTGAEALIRDDLAQEIIQGVTESSAVMQLGRRAPNMSSRLRKQPVLASLPEAYFVDGDTGRKKYSDMSWDRVTFTAEELAVIVPIPEAVLNDAADSGGYDIWGEVRPRIVEAMGRAFDAAVLYGENAPSDWPDDLLTAATAASNTVTLGANGDLYDDILGPGGTVALVEEDGFLVNGHIAARSLRAMLRGLRTDATGGFPIFMRSQDRQDMQRATRYELDGEPVYFPGNGAVDPTEALLFTGDWSKLVYTIRQDITWKLLTEAVIQDTDGSIKYNLAQQDMVAIRAVMRLAWQVPNPVTAGNAGIANPYPFSVLLPTGGGGGGGGEPGNGD